MAKKKQSIQTKKSKSKPDRSVRSWTKLEIVIAVLILFELGLSFLSYYESLENNYLCTEGGSCSTVISSQYGTIFGIKVALFGIMSFVLLSSFFVLRRHHKLLDSLFFLGGAFGSVFASYFLYLQFFVLKKICITCLFIDFTMIIILALSIVELKMRKD